MAQVISLGRARRRQRPSRFGSAHVIEVAGDYLMFDCGPAATHKLVKAGLFPTESRLSLLHSSPF